MGIFLTTVFHSAKTLLGIYMIDVIRSLKNDVKKLRNKLVGLTDEPLVLRYQLEIECLHEQIKQEQDLIKAGLGEPTGDELIHLFPK
jgi:hypothetical protein